MSKHPHRKELYDAALGILGEKRLGAIRDHVSQCDSCARTYTSLMEILKTSNNRDLSPSDSVERRLIQSYRSRREPVKIFRPALLRPIALGAASLMIAAGVYYSFFSGFTEQDLRISALSVSGTLAVDGKRTDSDTSVRAGSSLETDDSSTAEINLEDVFSVMMAHRSRLSIEKAQYRDDSRTGTFAFRLGSGTIYGQFLHGETGIEYSFDTPRALIHSIGTRFLLQADKKETTVLLTQGSLKVTSKATGETIEITEGSSCVVSKEAIRTGSLTDAQNMMIAELSGSPVPAPDPVTKRPVEGDRVEGTAPRDKTAADRENLENHDRDRERARLRREYYRQNREMREMRRDLREKRQERRLQGQGQ